MQAIVQLGRNEAPNQKKRRYNWSLQPKEKDV